MHQSNLTANYVQDSKVSSTGSVILMERAFINLK